MPTLFWTGKLSLPLKLMVNFGCLIAWITGNAQNTSAMKQRMKNGYNGKYSEYIHHYDEFGTSHYTKISKKLIEKVDCKEKKVLDVGCGTGILSLMILEKTVEKLICVDVSKTMLEKCKQKIKAEGFNDGLIEFHELDAEQLPFDDNSFDVVFLNMVLGVIPNHLSTITELTRVLRPGGTIAISAHGPKHYMEAIEAGLKTMTMRYFFGHRFEFWPKGENEVLNLFIKTGLKDIHTERIYWMDEFKNGREAFDFFAATSSLWWYEKLPSNLREKETEKTRAYFQSKMITSISSDVVFAYGTKQ
jgi:ubiquinone/menaquinone biosynthesis C-methylase UbiE